MLHFDANPITMDIWLQSYEGFNNAKNNMKQRNLNEHCFCQYLKNNIPDIRLIPLDHVYVLRNWIHVVRKKGFHNKPILPYGETLSDFMPSLAVTILSEPSVDVEYFPEKNI